MSVLAGLRDKVEDLGYQQAWDLLSKEVSDIDNFVDIVDWAGGDYLDDEVNHIFVQINASGELMTAIYAFKSKKEVLKELSRVFKQFDEEFLTSLKASSFQADLTSALKGMESSSGDFHTALGIYQGGSQGTEMFAYVFER